MAFNMASYSVDDLKMFLLEKKIPEEIALNFHQNEVSGAAFLKLTEEDLKELVPLIGIRTSVRDMMKEFQKEGNNKSKDEDTTESLVSSPSNSQETGLWLRTFSIPEKASFSGVVQQAIESGLISSRARRELVQILRTLITRHTVKPIGKEYNGVCQKLVSKFPKLQDPLGTDGFGSWKMALRNSFKNFRRSLPNDSKPKSPLEPPAKRKKVAEEESTAIESDLTIEESIEEYDEAVAELKLEWKKGKKKRSYMIIKTILERTATLRKKWIMEENPLISQILIKFPPLKDPRMLRREFRQIVGCGRTTFLEDWDKWAEKIVQVAKVEATSRPLMRKLLKEIEEDSASGKDYKDSVKLEILSKLLYPRGGKGNYFIKYVKTDLEEIVGDTLQKEPYIVVTGEVGEETTQYFICAEKCLTTESISLCDAFLDLICTYYVFNVSYPKHITGVFIFFQKIVIGVKDTQKLPNCLAKLVQNIECL